MQSSLFVGSIIFYFVTSIIYETEQKYPSLLQICVCNCFDFYHSAAIRIEYGNEIQIEFDN